jgi:hypothetical protein
MNSTVPKASEAEDKPCVFCGKKIRAYKVWKDWQHRTSHYACWKRDQQERAYQEMMRGYMLDKAFIERADELNQKN